MSNQYFKGLTGVVLLCVAAGIMWAPGCRKEAPTTEVMTLEGKVEKIKLTSEETGELSVSYYSEKHGQEVVGTGLVTRETEIVVNGVVAKLADLREGERVRGEVRIEKRGGKKQQIVLKIYVDRPKPLGEGGG